MPKAKPFVIADALLEAYATNNRITAYLIENLDKEAWRAEPPSGKGRTIGAVAAHIHNVRGMWLKTAGGDVVEKLEPRTATRPEALEALSRSHEALSKLLATALAGDGRIKGFKPALPVSSAIWFRMTPIIAAKSPCWRGERVIRCLRR
jgi:hypothetical protein